MEKETYKTVVMSLRMRKADVTRIAKVVNKLKKAGAPTTRNSFIIEAIKELLLRYGA